MLRGERKICGVFTGQSARAQKKKNDKPNLKKSRLSHAFNKTEKSWPHSAEKMSI